MRDHCEGEGRDERRITESGRGGVRGERSL